MRADQNFAKRTGECMNDVKPEKGKVRICTSTHAAALRATLRNSTRLSAPPRHSWSPHLHPHTSHLTPHSSPLALQGCVEP